MTMKLSANATDSVILGILDRGGKVAALANIRKRDGKIVPEAGEWYGEDPVQVLCDALADLKEVRAKHCIIFTNSDELVTFLKGPVKVPYSDEEVVHEIHMPGRQPTERNKGKLLRNPHWLTVFRLANYEKWRLWAVGPDKLKRVSELWQARFEHEVKTPSQIVI